MHWFVVVCIALGLIAAVWIIAAIIGLREYKRMMREMGDRKRKR